MMRIISEHSVASIHGGAMSIIFPISPSYEVSRRVSTANNRVNSCAKPDFHTTTERKALEL